MLLVNYLLKVNFCYIKIYLILEKDYSNNE